MSTSQKIIALVIAIVFGVATLQVSFYISSLNDKSFIEQQKANVASRVEIISTDLKHAINANYYMAQSLQIYLNINKDINQQNFYSWVHHSFEKYPYARNLGLAVNTVLTYVYPLEGNQQVIGFDYRSNANQWPQVEKAIIEKTTTIAGPLRLLQGGIGIICRTPIYLTEEDKQQYWGMVSMVIDFDKLMKHTNLDNPQNNLSIAIKGLNGTGETGQSFYGNEEIFNHSGFAKEIQFFGGSWYITAEPENGWLQQAPHSFHIKVVGAFFSLVIAMLAYLAISKTMAVKHLAFHDALTNLPNKRFFLESGVLSLARHIRYKSHGALYYINIDQFKNINDSYGKDAGDKLLKDFALKLKNNSRDSDLIARLQDDEFCVMVPEVENSEQARLYAEKIQEIAQSAYRFSAENLNTSASIGVIYFPAEQVNNDVEELLKKGKQAMQQAKHKGGARYVEANTLP